MTTVKSVVESSRPSYRPKRQYYKKKLNGGRLGQFCCHRRFSRSGLELEFQSRERRPQRGRRPQPEPNEHHLQRERRTTDLELAGGSHGLDVAIADQQPGLRSDGHLVSGGRFDGNQPDDIPGGSSEPDGVLPSVAAVSCAGPMLPSRATRHVLWVGLGGWGVPGWFAGAPQSAATEECQGGLRWLSGTCRAKPTEP